jgi:anti-sigma regulatory factor (Ser/Thr protein kinase)
MQRVADAVAGLHLSLRQLERLKTAVAEATMNAMEHGNHYQPDLPVGIRVAASPKVLSVHIVDRGGNQPVADAAEPDLEAKLSGVQTPRGWGLFLIKNMVDDMRVSSDDLYHTVELIVSLEGEEHARPSVTP